jgi:DNA-binding response OmpR family regulator
MKGKAQRIGIFDDDVSLVVSLKLFLQNKGLEAEICSTARTAEEFCRSFNPDLALLDLVWDKNQDASYSDIEAILKARDIPIVFLSSHVDVQMPAKVSARIIKRPKLPDQVYEQLKDWGLV